MWTAPFSLWWPKYLHNVDSSSSPLVAPLVLTMWTAPFSFWWPEYLHNVDHYFPSGGSSSTYTMWTAPFSLWWLEYLHNVDRSIFPLVAPRVLAQCGQLQFPSGGPSTYTMRLFGSTTRVTRVSLTNMRNINNPALQGERFVLLSDKSNLLYQGHTGLRSRAVRCQ